MKNIEQVMPFLYSILLYSSLCSMVHCDFTMGATMVMCIHCDVTMECHNVTINKTIHMISSEE